MRVLVSPYPTKILVLKRRTSKNRGSSGIGVVETSGYRNHFSFRLGVYVPYSFCTLLFYLILFPRSWTGSNGLVVVFSVIWRLGFWNKDSGYRGLVFVYKTGLVSDHRICTGSLPRELFGTFCRRVISTSRRLLRPPLSLGLRHDKEERSAGPDGSHLRREITLGSLYHV